MEAVAAFANAKGGKVVDDYLAYTRNKLIAEAFCPTGDIEKCGTGYTRIRSETASYPTMKFEFEEKPSAWLVTISYERRKTDEGNCALATEQATISRQYSRKAFLEPAIKDDLLAMLYPDMPNHPKQILPDRERKRSAKSLESLSQQERAVRPYSKNFLG